MIIVFCLNFLKWSIKINLVRQCFLVLILNLSWGICLVDAATYNVTSSSCSGTGSIREAVDSANSNPGLLD